ncbi:hypothetical protein 1992IndM4_0375 [Vibrio phage ICP1]|nr:hypothetical protein 1992IndM4_0375 [Vibrio phage ICP1]
MFKPIPEFPSYEINEYGIIRNIKTQKVKYVKENKQGYLYTQFKKNGEISTIKIHRLVAELFLGEPDENLKAHCAENYPYVVCVNHKDGDKTNNYVENLEWCSHAFNSKHSWATGLTPSLKGSMNGMAILDEDIVHKLCKAFESGMGPKEAVQVFGVSIQQASKIRCGLAWKHIWEQYDIKVRKRKSTKTSNDQ